MHVQLDTNTMQQVQQYEIQAINYDGMTPKNATRETKVQPP